MTARTPLISIVILAACLSQAYADCPPAPPTGVVATDQTDCELQFQIVWTPVDGATGYQVWYNTSPDPGTATQAGTASASPFVHHRGCAHIFTPVSCDGGTFYYWIVATSTCGCSTFSAPAVVTHTSKPLMLDDFCGGVGIEPPPAPAYGEWYAVADITWTNIAAGNLEGSPALKITDTGFTNGVYAKFQSVFPSTGLYRLQAKLHVVENSAPNGLQAFQVGVTTPGSFRVAGSMLPPCAIFGSYQGLTSGNDTSAGPQLVRTPVFEASAGQDILVALSSDVTSGLWNQNSASWGDTYVLVDSIELVPGVLETCSDVAAVSVVGPLVIGSSSVHVSGVGAQAATVRVYVNNVLRGELNVSGLGGGDVVVPVSGTLASGDLVKATQQYPGGPEGCNVAEETVSGTGPNATGLRFTLAVRETMQCAPVGSDGGLIGSIEYLGVLSMTACGVPVGTLIQPSQQWQTVRFSPSGRIVPGEGGDGVLQGASPCSYGLVGSLDSLLIVPATADSGPYTLYIDNIKSGLTLLTDFEGYSPGTEEVFFAHPYYLNPYGPSPMLPQPNMSAVNAAYGDSSAQSLRVSWQQRDAACSRYLRLKTNGAYLPNPTISLTQMVSLRLLLLPHATADLDYDSDVDTADFIGFAACATGPAVPYAGAVPAGCHLPIDDAGIMSVDFDRDGDVDADDFGELQAQMTGPG